MDLNSHTSKTVEIRVENLGRHHANLIRALSEAGLNSPQLDETLATHLQTSCIKCRIQVSSAELEQITVVEEVTQLAHSKLKRLFLGYCAREGCESAVYTIHLGDCAGVDWDMILKKVEELQISAQAKALEAQRQERNRQRKQRMGRIAVGVGIVVVLYLLRFAWSHGHLPLTKKPHKYEMDPASVPRLPSL